MLKRDKEAWYLPHLPNEADPNYLQALSKWRIASTHTDQLLRRLARRGLQTRGFHVKPRANKHRSDLDSRLKQREQALQARLAQPSVVRKPQDLLSRGTCTDCKAQDGPCFCGDTLGCTC